MPKAKATEEESSSVVASATRTTVSPLEKRSKDHVFRLVGQFRKSSRTGNTIYPPNTIDNEDVVDDPETGMPRAMRLLTGVKTLWKDEQTTIDEAMAGRMRPQIKFVDGVFRVRGNDKLLFDFMMKKNCCLSNPNRKIGSKVRYHLVDAEQSEKEQYETEMRRQQARSMAVDAPVETMMYHADYLNIDPYDENGEPLTEMGLRVKYIRYAQEHPDNFMESYGADNLKYNYIISRCVVKNKIIVDRSAMEAKWNTGFHIVNIPESKDPVEHMAHYAFTEEGRGFKKRLDELDITAL